MSELTPSKMKVAELRSELQLRGLDTKGVKALLVQRLEESLLEDDDASTDVSPAPEEKEEEDFDGGFEDNGVEMGQEALEEDVSGAQPDIEQGLDEDSLLQDSEDSAAPTEEDEPAEPEQQEEDAQEIAQETEPPQEQEEQETEAPMEQEQVEEKQEEAPSMEQQEPGTEVKPEDEVKQENLEAEVKMEAEESKPDVKDETSQPTDEAEVKEGIIIFLMHYSAGVRTLRTFATSYPGHFVPFQGAK